MKKILFVANFNSVMKEINQALMEYFQVQVCTANARSVEGMVSMYAPDLVLISLIGFDSTEADVFRIVLDGTGGVPVYTFGTEMEQEVCYKFHERNLFTKLIRPMSTAMVISTICKRLGMNQEAIDAENNLLNDNRKHIMCVDDNGLLLRNMKEMIPDQYRVSIVTSGTKAISMIEKDRPDLIFLDYEMPVCDGKMTLEMIRSEESMADIPVVFLTGLGERKYIEAVLALHPAGYILKPPSRETIMGFIEKILVK